MRSEILEKYPDAVDQFMKEAVKSAGRGKTDEDATAELIAEYGIIEKAPIAKRRSRSAISLPYPVRK